MVGGAAVRRGDCKKRGQTWAALNEDRSETLFVVLAQANGWYHLLSLEDGTAACTPRYALDNPGASWRRIA